MATAVLSGERLVDLDAEDMVLAAQELDPHDRCLVQEIAAAKEGELLTAAPYLDALLDASYGPADALARLQRDRMRYGLPADVSKWSEEVRRLVLALAAALAESLRWMAPVGVPREKLDRQGRARCPLVDPTGCSGLVLSLSDEEWPDGVLLAQYAAASDGLATAVRARGVGCS